MSMMIQMHVSCTFQEVLLQRVLEVVGSFVVENFRAHVSISHESALEEGSSLEYVVNVVQSSTRTSYLSQLPSYDGGCLAVIDKLNVSSVKPVGRPALE